MILRIRFEIQVRVNDKVYLYVSRIVRAIAMLVICLF